ncbi:polysaccharide biosynthesis/export family protein [Microbulbifer sp. ALW1]|uniref:polysaccharide biosynthesis/export family protein n=1 Tax=Microbulbifer sp. (strain ALW1) TaxID=1516059 RepID=UPI001356E0B5|nr:polysaccharide biosynthesis/export family protein [Microbulbifer sp. ALW1]
MQRSALRSVARLLLVLVTVGLSVSVSAEDKASQSDYRLGSGDKILINVYGEADLTVDTQLGDSGLINYPFLGELKVAGLTIAELESLIHKGLLGDYLVSPNVHVSILEYRPFFIHGEVERPGGFPYQPGMTVSKAAALAQGFTERASKTKIFVVRGDDASQTKEKVELSTLLRPGDVVTVEESFF